MTTARIDDRGIGARSQARPDASHGPARARILSHTEYHRESLLLTPCDIEQYVVAALAVRAVCGGRASWHVRPVRAMPLPEGWSLGAILAIMGAMAQLHDAPPQYRIVPYALSMSNAKGRETAFPPANMFAVRIARRPTGGCARLRDSARGR